ncbi:MAG: efflux transporter periplasmic adaptor subunit [Magnetococcales bacterium]|nr:efflux transporter periplasmic adaptor subunit [Magnetococcales bacterium]
MVVRPRYRFMFFYVALVTGFVFILLPLFAFAADSTDATVQIRAQLIARNQARIAAEMDGRIIRLLFREGMAFQKDQALVAFDCAEVQAQRDKAQAEVTMAHKRHQAKNRLADLKSLGILEVEIAQASVAQALAEAAYWKARADKCIIKAPFTGRVAESQVHAFDYVSKGDPLMKIVDDHNLELELIAPSIWRRWIKTGVTFTVHVDETGRDYPAEVLLLGAEINPVSQSFKVVGRITGPHADLIPGMSGSVTFPAH